MASESSQNSTESNIRPDINMTPSWIMVVCLLAVIAVCVIVACILYLARDCCYQDFLVPTPVTPIPEPEMSVSERDMTPPPTYEEAMRYSTLLTRDQDVYPLYQPPRYSFGGRAPGGDIIETEDTLYQPPRYSFGGRAPGGDNNEAVNTEELTSNLHQMPVSHHGQHHVTTDAHCAVANADPPPPPAVRVQRRWTNVKETTV